MSCRTNWAHLMNPLLEEEEEISCPVKRVPLILVTTVFELRHDKTNKMSVRPAKTQISLGIRPV